MPRNEDVYKFISRNRKNKKNLTGLGKTKRPHQCKEKVTVADWANWETSFWIKIDNYDSSVIIDSGVIEDLYEIIQKRKKGSKKKGVAFFIKGKRVKIIKRKKK